MTDMWKQENEMSGETDIDGMRQTIADLCLECDAQAARIEELEQNYNTLQILVLAHQEELARETRSASAAQARAETAERERDEAMAEISQGINAHQKTLDDYRACVEKLEAAESHLAALQPEGDVRACTCHPDDNPPVPCPRKYALTECREAALQARVKALEEGLRPFATFQAGVSAKDDAPAAYGVFHSNEKPLLVRHFRHARALLEDRSND